MMRHATRAADVQVQRFGRPVRASAVRSGRLMSTLVVPNPTSLLPSPSLESNRAYTPLQTENDSSAADPPPRSPPGPWSP